MRKWAGDVDGQGSNYKEKTYKNGMGNTRNCGVELELAVSISTHDIINNF